MSAVARDPLAPPLPAPFAIVLNAGSGHADTDQRTSTIETILGEAGRPYRLFPAATPRTLPATIDRALDYARAANAVVIAAGGDGTQSTVAAAVLPTELAFGVLPQGTFNFFARSRGIPTELDEGVRALLDARVESVAVAEVNGRVFLVNASIGMYAQLIEDREAFKQRFGRNRLVALASGLVSVLREHRQNELVVELKEARQTLRTTTLLVAGNALQLQRLGFPESEAVAEGALAAIIVRPAGTLGMLGLLVRGALGQLADALAVDSFPFTRLTVMPWRAHSRRGRPVRVAIDGELTWLDAPLVFSRAARPLRLLVPARPATEST